nr:hypothetical protein [Tanacetum cinerariifolium]
EIMMMMIIMKAEVDEDERVRSKGRREGHQAPAALPEVPTDILAPSSGESGGFETDESASTPSTIFTTTT